MPTALCRTRRAGQSEILIVATQYHPDLNEHTHSSPQLKYGRAQSAAILKTAILPILEE